jgi:hypothetical protein
MKRKPTSFLGLIVLACSSFTLIIGCRPGAPKAEANVNKNFEQNPPIATDITIKELEKPTDEGNVLVTATIPDLNTNFHAVMVGEEKMVLRDDGNGGDEKAGDHIFSIVLKEDLNAFQREVTNTQQRNLTLLKERPMVQFVNRSTRIIPQQQLRQFRFDSTTFKRGFKLPPGIFTIVPDPALRDHSLMITDLSVVEDPSRTFNPCTNAGTPMGAWTFGKLVTDMANTGSTGVTVQDFVRSWLDNWMNTQTINSDNVPTRAGIFDLVIVPWVQKSNGGATPTQTNWKTFNLDMKFAPFKLEAIVNRLDLRGNSGYSISNAGEGRFVFGVVNGTCNPSLFTVIFEYGIPKSTCAQLKAFAQQWYDLKGMTIGSAGYNTALEAITVQFAGAGTSPSKPNGNSLNQIRTNEVALSLPWELREFHIDGASHLVKEVTVTKEAAKRFNGTVPGNTATDIALLANYVNTNEAAVIANTNSIPVTWSGQAFLGGKAHTENPGHIWNGTAATGPGFINSDDARHVLSLNTCSGCHGGEGKTSIGNLINDPSGVFHNPFLQIAPHGFGQKATLAAFLTGDPSQADGLFKIADPANRPSGSPTVRGFNDLERRAQDLEGLVHRACRRGLLGLIEVLRFRPVNMTH